MHILCNTITPNKAILSRSTLPPHVVSLNKKIIEMQLACLYIKIKREKQNYPLLCQSWCISIILLNHNCNFALTIIWTCSLNVLSTNLKITKTVQKMFLRVHVNWKIPFLWFFFCYFAWYFLHLLLMNAVPWQNVPFVYFNIFRMF